MDFNLDETQTEIRTLAADLLAREATPDRLEAREKSGRPYDADLWQALAKAGLLGICLPESAGGAGYGPVELTVILREAGARVAPVPLAASLVAGLTIAQHGTEEQRTALAPLADGETALTYALREPGRDLREPPETTATGDRLTGRKTLVSYARESAGVLVSATDGTQTRLYLVDPADAEITDMPLATGEPGAVITLDGAPGQPVGGAEACDALRRNALVAITATASGVLSGALKLTTEYIKTRRQFDRALAEFQAVTVQIADVYIAGRALDVAVWSGAWRLAQGLPADEDLAIAALHTTDSALRALYTCQHLHGGIGLDVSYPLHRYFAWGKHAAHQLGGVEAQLDLIGALV
ncbi:acyl-CoA dehydrogenase [Acrocarpospora phusangensis]|uniref:Acyl-CoA dehydrogenase n=1 Tax=Acrocarpospora phusangensis TaxID=1070424 RepID=A0A919QCD2_9ACTN|nr:acyl-CoA dehydrogenase family protein [Acrocarpospora phusangensis]GIH24823.1 acyl-CoA dehydrogenase [Acrocarpospora phusangensis]